MLKNILRVAMVLLSLFSIMGSAGIFSPAILLAIFLMCLSGVIAYFGQLKLGVVSLALTSIALAVSPSTDISRMDSPLMAALYLVPITIGFGGVLLGAHKLQHVSGT